MHFGCNFCAICVGSYSKNSTTIVPEIARTIYDRRHINYDIVFSRPGVDDGIESVTAYIKTQGKQIAGFSLKNGVMNYINQLQDAYDPGHALCKVKEGNLAFRNQGELTSCPCLRRILRLFFSVFYLVRVVI